MGKGKSAERKKDIAALCFLLRSLILQKNVAFPVSKNFQRKRMNFVWKSGIFAAEIWDLSDTPPFAILIVEASLMSLSWQPVKTDDNKVILWSTGASELASLLSWAIFRPFKPLLNPHTFYYFKDPKSSDHGPQSNPLLAIILLQKNRIWKAESQFSKRRHFEFGPRQSLLLQGESFPLQKSLSGFCETDHALWEWYRVWEQVMRSWDPAWLAYLSWAS